jgi:ribosome-associated translation inhibitor RaiA
MARAHIGPTSSVHPNSTISTWTGAFLSNSGVWTSVSDKNRKTDFEEVDAGEILDRVASMPVRQWRYTNETAGIRHVGPTAQDFKTAFGLGADDKTIGAIDADGVALAAIQGLNQKLEEQLRKKEAEIEALKDRMARFEKIIAHLGPAGTE